MKLASCGGMSNETVLRSTFTKVSVQGRTKKSPEMPKIKSFCMLPTRMQKIQFLSGFEWTHKSLHDKPGPFGFLSVIRPSRKMTARSYSLTICMLHTKSAINMTMTGVHEHVISAVKSLQTQIKIFILIWIKYKRKNNADFRLYFRLRLRATNCGNAKLNKNQRTFF